MRVCVRVLICIGIAAFAVCVGWNCAVYCAGGTPAQTAAVFATDAQAITFPLHLEKTDLVLEELTGYEGPFLEDGSYEEVSGVAALVVRNQGTQLLESAEIHLYAADRFYVFQLTWLPPGAACAVLEQQRRGLPQESITLCTGTQKAVQENSLHPEKVHISENRDGHLQLENRARETLDKIRICYKTYLAQADMYIGGVTNEVQLSKIGQGKTLCLLPPRYASGYSKVVFVKSE